MIGRGSLIFVLLASFDLLGTFDHFECVLEFDLEFLLE